jgi:MazG family protein
VTDTAADRFARLVEVMRTLRGPDGCPWDREQTHQTLAPYLLEEAYEVVDAIADGDSTALCDELGDLLFEAVFLAQVSDEQGDFRIDDVLAGVVDKLIRRHPHVFDGVSGKPLSSAAEVVEQWDAIKVKERAARGRATSALDGVPRAMPALLRAHKLGRRAAAVGFDWPRAADVLEKIREETGELEAAMAGLKEDGRDLAHVEEELGDVLFALANLSRKLGIEPEAALRRANDKFTARFQSIERSIAASGRRPQDLTLAELEAHWTKAKETEPGR